MRVVEGEADIEDLDAFVADLGAIGDECDCAVQAFDATLVAGRDHLEAAVERANRSFERGENVADDRAVEILLYAAARRQINRAFRMGVAEGVMPVAVVVDGEREANAADAVADLLTTGDTLGVEYADADAVADFFDITEAERAATGADLAALVCERVALLDVEK